MHIPLLLFICSMLLLTCDKCLSADNNTPVSSSSVQTLQASSHKKNIGPSLDLTIKIIGTNENIKNTLLNNITIYQATKEPKLSVIRIQNLHALATKQLSETLEAIGYYNATITQSLTNKREHWLAVYNITLGKPILINNLSLSILNEGAKNKTLVRKLKTPKLKIKHILNHIDYEETKQNLLVLLQENGYLSAKFINHKVNINTTTHTADIELTIDTGKQYVFGDVKFIDCIYSTELLNRFITFKKGEPYTSKALAKFRKNLTDAAMFKKMKILPRPNLADPNENTVPIEVSIHHSPLNHYLGNLGYGTNTGIRGGIGWQHRFVSPAGHQLSNHLNLSRIHKQATINYMIPGSNPGTDRYIIGTGLNQEIINDQYSRQKDISFTTVNKLNNMQRYFSLKFLHENFRFAPDMSMEATKFLLPGAKWIWINSGEDNGDAFAHGSRFEISMQGGLGMFLSATDFIQTELQGKWIVPINTDLRLVVIGNIGSTAIKNFNDLPLSLRFFAGGDKGIRGFAYHTLGPTRLDNAGNKIVVGGKNLLTTTAELEKKLYGKLSAAVFVDSGNAMNNWNTKFATGAGIGLRLATPIGSFKFDIAKQITEIQHKKLRIHLTFGTDLQ